MKWIKLILSTVCNKLSNIFKLLYCTVILINPITNKYFNSQNKHAYSVMNYIYQQCDT